MSFGGGRVAVAGIVGGFGIAVGGSAVLLGLGQSLGPAVLTVLVVLALVGGGLVCLVSAFFGLVIPRHLGQGPWMDPEKWRRFALERRLWHERHGAGAWGPWYGARREEPVGEGDAPGKSRRRRGESVRS